MKVTLEFNLPEEQWDLDRALEGATLTFFLQEYSNYLRSLLKRGDLTMEESAAYNTAYETFLSMLNDNNIDIFKG